MKPAAGLPLSSWPLARLAMRARLDVLRLLADAGRGHFGLLVLSPKSRWRRFRAKDLLRTSIAAADAWGWLPKGQLGVVFAQPLETPPETLMKVCEAFQSRIAALADVEKVEVFQYPLTPRQSDEEPMAQVAEGQIDRYFVLPTPWWKRTIDIAAAAAGLLLLSPLLAIVSMLIKVTSPGPILYRQQRTGRGGQAFVMYKFRSMTDGAHALQAELRHLNQQDGPAFKIQNDPRVTRLGGWLRKTCIDELPQLWNVLRGDMSLVGPRPLPCRESAACLGWRRRRLDVTPGITCFWQINGRSLVSFDRWMQQDLEYVQHRSFWLDLWILFSTVPALIFKEPQPAATDRSQVEAVSAESP